VYFTEYHGITMVHFLKNPGIKVSIKHCIALKELYQKMIMLNW